MSCFHVFRIRYFQRPLFSAGLYPLIGCSLPEFNHYGFLRPLATTLLRRALNIPRSLAMRSCTGFRVQPGISDVIHLSAFFSAPLHLPPVPPPFFISYLQTKLVSISIHCARHAQDVIIEKLRRHDSSNLNCYDGKCRETNMKREFLRSVQPRSFLRKTIRFHRVRESHVTNNVDVNFVPKATPRTFTAAVKSHNYDWP